MESVGLPVNRLIRVSYGPFRLGELKAGAVEEVKQRVMRDQLGMSPDTAEAQSTPKPARKPKPGQPPRRTRR